MIKSDQIVARAEFFQAYFKCHSDEFKALLQFYNWKNKNTNIGLFSTLAGGSFPDGWLKAFESGIWNEKGEYGDNFRECFGLRTN